MAIKVGDFVRVKIGHTVDSRSLNNQIKRILDIKRVNSIEGSVYYMVEDGMGGLWPSEVEPVGLSEDDFEYICNW